MVRLGSVRDRSLTINYIKEVNQTSDSIFRFDKGLTISKRIDKNSTCNTINIIQGLGQTQN